MDKMLPVKKLILLKLILFWLCVAAFAFPQRAFAAASETGEWSKPVDGVQGRLIIEEGSVVHGTQVLAVYLELRNVSDVLNPLEIYYSNDNTKGTVTNKDDKAVASVGLPASIITPPPYWLSLPFDSTLRFRISVSGYGVPPNAGALLALDSPWLLRQDKDAPYYLQGNFQVVEKKDQPERRQWHGTLHLPKVKIPVPLARKAS